MRAGVFRLNRKLMRAVVPLDARFVRWLACIDDSYAAPLLKLSLAGLAELLRCAIQTISSCTYLLRICSYYDIDDWSSCVIWSRWMVSAHDSDRPR